MRVYFNVLGEGTLAEPVLPLAFLVKNPILLLFSQVNLDNSGLSSGDHVTHLSIHLQVAHAPTYSLELLSHVIVATTDFSLVSLRVRLSLR